MKKATLYHRRASGKVKVWTTWLDHVTIHTEWGQQDGRMQHTADTVRGTSAVPASDRAEYKFEQRIARRKKKGYVDTLAAVVADINVDDTVLNFDRLPKSFAPAKPKKKVDPDEVARLAKANKIFIQRKRDGMRHYLVSDTKGRVRIYSSGKDDVTEHLKPLLEGLVLPPRTVLDTELVVTEPGKQERDGFLIVSGIARSLPERARKQIALAQGMGARVQLMAFDLLWESGTPVYRYRYEDRYKRLAKVIEKALVGADYPIPVPLVRMPLVSISPTRLATLTEAMEMVKKFKWEGLVVWRKDEATVVRVNGSPCRCNCWKVKPIGEEDVVALGFELGKGKNAKVVGKFRIAVVNGTDKSGRPGFVPMGKCGTGLTDAQRVDALRWKYPCVIQIEYDQRSDKGFRFPVFIRKRDDKLVTECGR